MRRRADRWSSTRRLFVVVHAVVVRRELVARVGHWTVELLLVMIGARVIVVVVVVFHFVVQMKRRDLLGHLGDAARRRARVGGVRVAAIRMRLFRFLSRARQEQQRSAISLMSSCSD